MPQNFIESCRGQGFLLPADVRDWVPADRLGWFVIDAVKEMGLDAFYGAYRADGHGRVACEPSVVVTLIVFGFATGVRSSRAIERHCRGHVADRVIAGDLVSDRVTISGFICRHGEGLAGLFSRVLELCAVAGLVDCGVVAIDGTRIAANVSRERNQEFGQVALEIVEQVKARDEAGDEEFGEARGDELPEQLRTPGRASSVLSPGAQEAQGATPVSRSPTGAGRRPSGSGSMSLTPIGSSPGRGGGRGGGARRIVSLRASAGRIRIRSRARERSDCCRRPSGLRIS